jgi:hypothetical protein
MIRAASMRDEFSLSRGVKDASSQNTNNSRKSGVSSSPKEVPVQLFPAAVRWVIR